MDDKKQKEEEVIVESIDEDSQENVAQEDAPKADSADDSTDQPSEEKESAKGSKSGKKKADDQDKLKEKIEDLENQLKRSVADYRNQEMRFNEEKKEFVKYANRDLLLRLIPAFDTLFLAAKYVTDEGIKITIKNLQEALMEDGVQRIEAEGKKFDPTTMEVVTTATGEDDVVLEELRPGFTLNGKLVRPANVKVGKTNN